MSHSHPWRQTFDLRHTELDWTGHLSVVGMSRLFQEAAGAHAAELNASVELLRKSGLTWVLAKFHIRMHSRAPRWRDTIAIETWRAGIERLFAARDYRATAADGSLVAEATSYWAVFDLASRKATAIPRRISDDYPVDAPRVPVGAQGFKRVAEPARVDAESERRVQLSDLDTNGHVTNSAYMIWALDSIPAREARAATEAGRLAELEILFKSEAFLGDTIRCQVESEFVAGSPGGTDADRSGANSDRSGADAARHGASSGGTVPAYLHRLVRAADEREVALARTTFR